MKKHLLIIFIMFSFFKAYSNDNRPYLPVNFSFLYPFALNYGQPDIHTNVNLAIILSRTGSVRGVDLVGHLSIIEGNLEGAQISGLVTYVGGSVKGFQLTSTLNYVEKEFTGFQLSGIANIVNGHFGGLQMGLLNFCKSMDGSQIGMINISGNFNGFQLGIINVTKEMNGIPIGLINISENGGINFLVWTSNLSATNLSAKFSSNYVFSSIHLGRSNNKDKDDSLFFGYSTGLFFKFLSFRTEIDISYFLNVKKIGRLNENNGDKHFIQSTLTFEINLLKRLGIFLSGGVSKDIKHSSSAFPVLQVGLSLL